MITAHRAEAMAPGDKSSYLLTGWAAIDCQERSPRALARANGYYRFCQQHRIPYVVTFLSGKGRKTFLMELDTVAYPVLHDVASPIPDWIAEAILSSLKSLPRNGEVTWEYGPDTCRIDSLESVAAETLAFRVGTLFVEHPRTVTPTVSISREEEPQWRDKLNSRIDHLIRLKSMSPHDRIRELLAITWADGFLMGQGEHPGNEVDPDEMANQILTIQKVFADD